jgi:hypothetical protein
LEDRITTLEDRITTLEARITIFHLEGRTAAFMEGTTEVG